MNSRDADVVVDFQCWGEWKSQIKPTGGTLQRDGNFVLSVDNTGKITGQHKPLSGRPPKDIKEGKCEHPNGKHRITLEREEDGNVYKYEGEVTALTEERFEARGTRKTKPALQIGEETPSRKPDKSEFAEDEWVATRPPT